MSQDNITITIQEIVENVIVSVENLTDTIVINIIDDTQTVFVNIAELGEPGLPGKSVYDIAVDNGFVGTEADWLIDFKNQIIAGVVDAMKINNTDDYTNNELTEFIFNHQERIEELLNAMSLPS
jgi:hypothetical protein